MSSELNARSVAILPKIRRIFFLSLLYILLAFSFTQKINLSTADLGRHLKNGEIFFQHNAPIRTNFYSYTHSDFPTINHHWLTGVIFYLIYLVGGFSGLSIFYTALFLITFYFFFQIAEKFSNFHWAYFVSALSLPLITSREEIRPEGLSCFFVAVYLFILFGVKKGSLNVKWLYLIPFLQILWVNIHIFFFMGFVLIGVFFFDAILIEKNQKLAKQFLWIGVLCLAAIFVNPFGWQGAATPLTVFKEYGYELAENQTVFFMRKRFPENIEYPYTEIILMISLLSFVLLIVKKKLREYFILWVLMAFFSILAVKTVRSIALFGLFFVPFGAAHFLGLVGDGTPGRRSVISKIAFGIAIITVLISLQSKSFIFSPYKKISPLIPEIRKTNNWTFYLLTHPGKMIGLLPDVNAGAEFFKTLNVKGPVFNNYDIGGYLIFHLYPKEKVFVDNRPEAYPSVFFQNEYVPMQEDDKIWQQQDEKYHFNVIFFYRQDQTPWAQAFLIKRISDPGWAPVFVDNYALILLRRNAENADLIKRYELPKSLFIISEKDE